MLNSGQKINILTLVLSEKKILNETKNHTPPPPPPFKLNGRSPSILFSPPYHQKLELPPGSSSTGSRP